MQKVQGNECKGRTESDERVVVTCKPSRNYRSETQKSQGGGKRIVLGTSESGTQFKAHRTALVSAACARTAAALMSLKSLVVRRRGTRGATGNDCEEKRVSQVIQKTASSEMKCRDLQDSLMQFGKSRTEWTPNGNMAESQSSERR